MSDMHGTVPTVVGNADNVSTEHLFAVSFAESTSGKSTSCFDRREDFTKDYVAGRLERLVDLRAFEEGGGGTLFATATTSASSTFDEDQLERAYEPCLEVVPVGHVPIFKPKPTTTSTTKRADGGGGGGGGGGFQQLRESARASVSAQTAIEDAMNAVSRCHACP
jgi:hypothetical protein